MLADRPPAFRRAARCEEAVSYTHLDVYKRQLLGVPVALEIGDQGRAEMAVGLLARIDREIGAEHVERLLGDAEGAPVARRADRAGAGEARDHTFQRLIHAAVRDDLVADEAPFRAVAFEPALVLDRLARDAVAGEAWQPHIGGAGNDALLARRQGHERALFGEHIVHHQERLAVPADREGLHRGDPRLLDRLSAELVGRRVVQREPAIDLVHPAEVALEIPDEGDAPVIEVREVDAGAEHPAAPVFGMLDHRPAHHRDLAGAIEQREIDADLRAGQRRLILGIEKARIVLGHHGGLAVAVHRRAFELHPALALELRQQGQRIGARQ